MAREKIDKKKSYLAVLASFDAVDVLLLPEGLRFERPHGHQVRRQRQVHLLDGGPQQTPASLARVQDHDETPRTRFDTVQHGQRRVRVG